MTKLPMTSGLPSPLATPPLGGEQRQMTSEEALTSVGTELGLGSNPVAINSTLMRLREADRDSFELVLDMVKRKKAGVR